MKNVLSQAEAVHPNRLARDWQDLFDRDNGSEVTPIQSSKATSVTLLATIKDI